MKIVKKNKQKIFIFTAVKKNCILHGRVFVMEFRLENEPKRITIIFGQRDK